MRQFSIASCLAIALYAVWESSPSAHAADKPSPGQQIYAKTCAECHGKEGAGGDGYEKPLAGDLSVPQLAKLVKKTMPQDEPGTLSAEQSQQVAQYVYDAFYSAIARSRNQPARIELARLTVRQYRLALADLIGSFRQPPVWDEKRGLGGEYYEGRRPGDRRKRKETRVDPQVNFDFGKEAAVPDIKTPYEFSIRWDGSVLAPETGDYRFVVHTEHAARLWLNDKEQPVIDAWVKSGDDTDYEAEVFLVAGRVYPLKLEFTKAKQGVDDSEKTQRAAALEAGFDQAALETSPRRIGADPRPPHGSARSPTRCSCAIRRSRRTTAATAGNGARRFPKPGNERQPMGRSRRRVMWPSISID